MDKSVKNMFFANRGFPDLGFFFCFEGSPILHASSNIYHCSYICVIVDCFLSHQNVKKIYFDTSKNPYSSCVQAIDVDEWQNLVTRLSIWRDRFFPVGYSRYCSKKKQKTKKSYATETWNVSHINSFYVQSRSFSRLWKWFKGLQVWIFVA